MQRLAALGRRAAKERQIMSIKIEREIEVRDEYMVYNSHNLIAMFKRQLSALKVIPGGV